MKVLFSTNSYMKDFGYLANGGFGYKALINDYPFDQKWIILNQDDPVVVPWAFDGIADIVIDRKNATNITLATLNLPRDTFVDKKTKVNGFMYSIDSLIELVYAKDFDYICHFCGDVELYRKADWITEGIKKLEEGFLVARPKLPRYSDSPQEEQEFTQTDIFSDHVYLIHRKTILEAVSEIFSLTEPSCNDIHVEYGGESFERKMTRYLKSTGKKIAIIQNAEEMASPL